LTANGEDEARKLGKHLQDILFSHVLTSPLKRAQQTCALVGLAQVPEIEPDLVEWDYGDYEGKQSVDIRKEQPDWTIFRDGCQHGEMPTQISDRADRLIARLRTLSGNVALFSHGQFGGVLAARWIGLAVIEAQHFPLGTAPITPKCRSSLCGMLLLTKYSTAKSFCKQPREPAMGQKFVIGNWKMNTTAAEARHLSQAIANGMGIEDSITVVVCPPFPYLSLVGEILKGHRVALGAQNLYPEKEGPFTGEVSPTMLLDLGCQYVILGHSDRRHKLGESDTFINQKVQVALAAGLDAIFCVGETLEQRKADQTKKVLDRQLLQGLDGLSAATLTHLSIAYEPVWAIGSSGHHATPQQAQEAHTVIRHRFGQMFGERSAKMLAIHYGGSVNPENADALLRRPGVDGVLIGGDSLNAKQFLAIVKAGISETQSQVEAA